VFEIQGALEIVQPKIWMPLPRLLTAVVADAGELMLPLPWNKDQVPDPLRGTFALRVTDDEQVFWVGPAWETEIVTDFTRISSKVGMQVPFDTVHLIKFVPDPKPEIAATGENGLEIIPLPLIRDQLPVPVAAGRAFSVAEVEQTVWLSPALAMEIDPDWMICNVDEEELQGALEMVHANEFCPGVSPVTFEKGESGFITTALPLTTVHNPLPYCGWFPESENEVAQSVWSMPALDGLIELTVTLVSS
jgi:hypothetical protein